MTTPEALLELADRVEREEPSRELNKAIAFAALDLEARPYSNRPRVRVMWLYRRGTNDVVFYGESSIPAYTTSLDSAVTLVPENASVNLGLAIMADGAVWRAVVGGGMACWAANPAAALTAAALRARAADMATASRV